MTTKTYSVYGMHCAACSSAVERVLNRLDGVESAEVNLIMQKATIVFDENKVGFDDFVRVVSKAGFTIDKIKEQEKEEKQKRPYPLIIALTLSAILLYLSMGQMLFSSLPIPSVIDMDKNPKIFVLFQLILCVPVVLIGRRFFTNGYASLFRKNPNMDTLVAIGATASFLYSLYAFIMVMTGKGNAHNLYFESVATVISLVMLGKYFEEKSKKKTTSAISKLLSLTPEISHKVVDEKIVNVPTKAIAISDTLVVKPFEKIPLDSVVLNGESSVDESMLTGESLPVYKSKGSTLTGGSINGDGSLTVKATATLQGGTLSKIVEFVKNAQNKKAPISKIADSVAKVFVPTVISIALLASIVWLIIGKDMAFVVKIFTSVLVIACPCALGLATPTAIMVGTGMGANHGILIKNGESLEKTHKTKVVVFDKTGTLTYGKMQVCDVIAKDKNKLLSVALSGEKYSTHPIATAIVTYSKENGINEVEVKDLKVVAGSGVSFILNDQTALIGKRELLLKKDLNLDDFIKTEEKLSSEGKTTMYVSLGNEVLGLITLKDEIKESAKVTIQNLTKMGIKTVLLSGDNYPCVKAIAKSLDMTEFYAEVSPNQKAEIIQSIKEKFGDTIMVGDGINDAVALAQADVGIALGSGTDIAIESGDVVLMSSDLNKVTSAIKLSRETFKTIKLSLFWAFLYNCICIPLACGVLYPINVLMSPMIAGLAMSLSSVCVVSNALLLRFRKI